MGAQAIFVMAYLDLIHIFLFALEPWHQDSSFEYSKPEERNKNVLTKIGHTPLNNGGQQNKILEFQVPHAHGCSLGM